jgi:hypothetical protein
MGILLPALSAVREQSRRAVCGQNEKNTALGLFLYANDYDGKLPLNEVDRWLFDVSYWTTDIILKTGAFDRHIFYCPSWRDRDNIIFWRYGENLAAGTPESYATPEPTAESTRKNYHRIMGYFWFIDIVRGRSNPPMSSDNVHKEWVRSLATTERAPATVELIADVTASNGPDRLQSDFTKATGGCWSRWQVYDRTNHLKKGTRPGTMAAFRRNGTPLVLATLLQPLLLVVKRAAVIVIAGNTVADFLHKEHLGRLLFECSYLTFPIRVNEGPINDWGRCSVKQDKAADRQNRPGVIATPLAAGAASHQSVDSLEAQTTGPGLDESCPGSARPATRDPHWGD